LLVILAAALAGCGLLGTEVVTGSGSVATETRTVDDFTAVELAASGDVTIAFGQAAGLTIEADDNLLPYLTSEVRGDRLVLGTRSNVDLVTENPIRYSITVQELTAVTLPGSGTIQVDPLQASAVEFSLPGSGTIMAAGTADEVEVTLQGSGNVDLGDLRAGTGRVRLDGSGNITVWVTGRLEASLPGSGNIFYFGQPTLAEDINGSGSISSLGDK
jgi:hypothetical protein